MESSYTKLLQDLDVREKHILQLESELLRVDYQYGVIVKDLKQKYQKISQEFSLNHYTLRQCKKQNKRLQSLVATKQKQLEYIKLQIEDYAMKNKIQEESTRRSKEENEMLRNEIKFLEANQSKYMLQVQQAQRKRDQHRDEVNKLQEKVAYLEKQIKKSQLKRKQLEELVEQEVLDTQQRIQSIGIEYFSKNTMAETPNINMSLGQTMKRSSNNLATNPEEREKELINDWESDMKKLKNCIDYGSPYMLMFDPMNFDRTFSRDIFKFIRKCMKQVDDMSGQLKGLQTTHTNCLAAHKLTLNRLEQQLQKIAREKNNLVKIDSQIQTENPSCPDAQKMAYQLSELNTKLKIKNAGLIQCIQIMGLRNVATLGLLQNSYKNAQYWKLNACKTFQKGQKLLKPANRLRVAFYSVLFIQLAKKNYPCKSGKNSISLHTDEKIRTLFQEYQKLCPENIELQKVKDSVVIDHCSQYRRTSDIIQYYQFKLKRHLEAKSICLPHNRK